MSNSNECHTKCSAILCVYCCATQWLNLLLSLSLSCSLITRTNNGEKDAQPTPEDVRMHATPDNFAVCVRLFFLCFVSFFVLNPASDQFQAWIRIASCIIIIWINNKLANAWANVSSTLFVSIFSLHSIVFVSFTCIHCPGIGSFSLQMSFIFFGAVILWLNPEKNVRNDSILITSNGITGNSNNNK